MVGQTGIIKRSRVRHTPNRRWTEGELKKLMTYMLSSGEIEKPTAQLYYRKFSRETNVEAPWAIIRSKVRNMRRVYEKTKAWATVDGIGLDERELKEKILALCSYYYDFEQIYATPTFENVELEPDSMRDFLHRPFEFKEESLVDECSVSSHNSTAQESASVAPPQPEVSAATPKRGLYAKTAVADILSVQAELMEMKRKKLDQDLMLRKEELALRQRELELHEQELAIREREIGSQEKIKILELQMKERIANKELELKYKK